MWDSEIFAGFLQEHLKTEDALITMILHVVL